MNNCKQTLCNQPAGNVGSECLNHRDHRDEKILSILGTVVAAGIFITGFFLFRALLDVSSQGGVPF